MKAYQQEQSQEQNLDSQQSNQQFGPSNSELLATLSGEELTLKYAVNMIAEGRLNDAKSNAHQMANIARAKQKSDVVDLAGKVWTLANHLSSIQGALLGEMFSEVKSSAKNAADLARSLMEGNADLATSLNRIVSSAGGYWNIADAALKEQQGGKGAAAKAQNSETVDQHRLPSSNGGAYCGIATSMMLLNANDLGKGSVQQQMSGLASEMYISGSGSDVDLMAKALRKRGLDKAQSTRGGTLKQLIGTLDKGQPVPFGVSHTTGTIVKLNSGGSKRYPHKRAGDAHGRSYPGSGHWVLVVGYEGSPEKPTHFIFNDPDLGGQMKATKAQLERMGEGNGNFWQVHQT